jgi:uncharacterized membrane protein YeaQ/YmgE (transglycosylase-associated protein family)
LPYVRGPYYALSGGGLQWYAVRAYYVDSPWSGLGYRIAGFIGGKIVNRQGQGFWLDIALGIIGAIVGGYLFSFFGKEGVTGLNLYSMLVAIAGSVVVLLLYNLVTGRRAI